MTVPATTRRAGPFNGNSVTTSFPFEFLVFDEADVQVVLADSNGTETVLVLDSDYTVTLNVDQVSSPGGSVTYPAAGTAMSAGTTLTVVGALDYEQTLDLPGGGAFSPTALENALDRTVIQVQQLAEEMNRTLRLAVSSGPDVDGTLPPPEADFLLGWNGDGTALRNVDASVLASIVAFGQRRTLIANGGLASYTLAADPGSIHNTLVAVGGVVQTPGVDYTLSGVTVTPTTVWPVGTGNIVICYGESLPQGTSNLPFKSITEWGVVGDGVTDNTADFQAALDECAGAYRLYVPAAAAHYKVSDTLDIPSNTYVFGDGHRSMVKMDAAVVRNTPLVLTGGRDDHRSNITIEAMGFDYNRARWTNENGPGDAADDTRQSVISVCNSDNVSLLGLRVIDGYKHGIDVLAPTYLDTPLPTVSVYDDQPSYNVWIDRCYITGSGDDNITTHHSHTVWVTRTLAADPSGIRTNDNSNNFEIDDGSRDIFISDCKAVGGVCGLQIKGHHEAPAPYNVHVSNFLAVNNIIGVELRHTDWYGLTADDEGDPVDVVNEDGDVVGVSGVSPTARNVSLSNVTVVAPRNTVATYTSAYPDGGVPVGVTLKAMYGVRVRSYDNVKITNLAISDGSSDSAEDYLPFIGMDGVPFRTYAGARNVHVKNLTINGFATDIAYGRINPATDLWDDPITPAAVLVTGSFDGGLSLDGLTIDDGPRVGVRATADALDVSVTNYRMVANQTGDTASYPVNFTGADKRIGHGFASGYANAPKNEANANYVVRKSAASSGGVTTTPQPMIDLVWQEGSQDLGAGEGGEIRFLARLAADTSDYKVGGIRYQKTGDGDASRDSDIVHSVSADGGATTIDVIELLSTGVLRLPTSVIVGTGTTTPIDTEAGGLTARLEVHGTTQNNASLGIFNWAAGGLSDARYTFAKSKSGTVGTRGILANTDQVGTIAWCGDDGVTFQRGAQIVATVDGSPALNVMPMRLDFYTRGGGASDARALRLGTDQSVTSSAACYVARQAIVSAAGTTVLTAADHFVVVTGSTTHTLTLPAAATGRVLLLKNRSSGAVTVNRAGADTIDGGTTFSLTANQGTTLVANGTDWCRVSNA